MAAAPALAHPERAGEESGADQKRLAFPAGLSTGIWWYASYPNHYAGDASGATAARGAALQDVRAEGIAQAIAWVKADTVAPQLQQEFFEKSGKPLETKQ